MKLEIKNINKSFGTSHILKDVSFGVESGKAMGFLGRNGAGKTTLIRILMDVFRAESGTITIDGNPFHRDHFRIGYLPEERGMYSKISVLDQLVYFAMLRGVKEKEAKKSALYWIERFGLGEYTSKLLETLSKGNQQKVQIAQSFINHPDILILDEPFSGLDPVNAQVFKDALREFIQQDKCVIFSSHQMAYVEEFCDDVALIDHGKIILHGNLQEIKKEQGKNKLHIQFVETTDTAARTLLSTLPVHFEQSQNSYIVSLQHGYTKKNFLSDLLSQDFELGMFADYKPSLEDIFVSKVGGNHA